MDSGQAVIRTFGSRRDGGMPYFVNILINIPTVNSTAGLWTKPSGTAYAAHR